MLVRLQRGYLHQQWGLARVDVSVAWSRANGLAVIVNGTRVWRSLTVWASLE